MRRVLLTILNQFLDVLLVHQGRHDLSQNCESDEEKQPHYSEIYLNVKLHSGTTYLKLTFQTLFKGKIYALHVFQNLKTLEGFFAYEVIIFFCLSVFGSSFNPNRPEQIKCTRRQGSSSAALKQ